MTAPRMLRWPLSVAGWNRWSPIVLVVMAMAWSSAEALTLRILGAASGLSAKVVPSLLVDRDGFLWVASREGLFRYDGYRAVRYMPDAQDPRSITDVDLRSLYQDAEGHLWIGTNTGGLNRFDAATETFQHYRYDSADPTSLSNDSVYFMADGPDGGLWVGTQIGLSRLDRATGKFKRYLHDPTDPRSLSNNYVYTVYTDSARRLWVATLGGGLNRWEPETDSFTRFDLASLAAGPPALNDVFALAEDQAGTLWAGTRAGLIRIDRKRTSFVRKPLLETGAEQPLVTWLTLSSKGSLWICTLAQGLFQLEPSSGEARQVGEESLPAGEPVLTVAESTGAYFVGMWGGGVRFGRESALEFTLFDVEHSSSTLRNGNITAVLATTEAGRPWIGSFGGGLQRLDIEAVRADPPPGAEPELSTQGVASLARTPDGRLYAGTQRGLWELGPGDARPRVYRHAEDDPASLGEGYVTSLLPDSSGGGLWVGVGGSGLHFLAAGTTSFTAYRHDPAVPDSLSDDYITSLLAEPGGSLWVGTRSGGLDLCHIRPWSCQHFPGRPGTDGALQHHHVTMLLRDGRGRVWVATDGGGLHLVVQEPDGKRRFRNWSRRDGLVSDSVMAIAEDRDASLWLSSREGLTRLDPERGPFSSHVLETGMPVSNFTAGAAASDDRFLYFGTVSGLLAFPRGQAPTEFKPLPARITTIDSPELRRARPDPAWRMAEHTLAYGDTLSIEFAVLDFSESLHEYEYRLAPEDPWTQLGPRHEVTFFGLDPGPHVFEVRGRDVRWLWSEAPPLRLEVVPPFWMTVWFRVLASLSLALIAVGAPVLRVRALERRNKELILLQEQREHALTLVQKSEAELKSAYAGLSRLTQRLESAKEEERQHISRELHDELGQNLTAVKIQLQMLQRSDPTTHENGLGQRLEDAVHTMDSMIGQVRALSLRLRPPLLDEAGLVPALESHLQALSERTGVPISMLAEPGIPSCRPEVETALFRVVQEAVSNSLRHAGSKRIDVSLSMDQDSVTAVVEDDGLGFDVLEVRDRSRRGEHLGLLGIQERLLGVGGTLELDSAPGKGTRLVARVKR